MSEITKPRPKFLALHEIRFRLAGFVSGMHRVSGLGLFLLLPFLIYLLQLSLAGTPQSHEQFSALTGNLFIKLILLGLSWAYLHHFCAGIRFLLMDMHIGVDKIPSQKSAKAVYAVSLLLTVFVAFKLLGGH